ncbi:malonate decarboxylase subunit epsilon [Neisseria leonii]|uniref:malonate decarboxylase subunit epsilon n=1 Tax=Neisseria leonii TaxID=2995413 RepID=UPI00237A2ABA|nr:malonate decarboxylase subunit epsilon [Neisseria sp. 3986]MDD9326520.1 malonate decarboxylase subunit epsilon [Neisseria sp. 3986]
MATVWVFPGQGAQRAGMLHELQPYPLGRTYLAQASDVLQRDVMQLDNDRAFASSEAVQICLFAAGYIGAAVMRQIGGLPDYVAGLSAGAWTAAAVAGVLDFSDGLRLMALRGRLMQEAYPGGYGMTAVIGADRRRVGAWVAQVHSLENPVYTANFNAPDQTVIAGKQQAMRQVAGLAKAGGAAVRQLAVTVPSHCELLAQQAAQLQQAVRQVVWHAPKIRYLSGSHARMLVSADKIADDLVFNMCRPVDWEHTLQAARERGIRLQIEMPPGSTLSALARRAWPEGTVAAMQDTRLDTLAALMRRERETI